MLRKSKEKLVGEIGLLSDSSLNELEKFIQYLQFKQNIAAAPETKLGKKTNRDPLVSAFGICDVAPFCDEIDETVYGER